LTWCIPERFGLFVRQEKDFIILGRFPARETFTAAIGCKSEGLVPLLHDSLVIIRGEFIGKQAKSQAKTQLSLGK